MTSPILNQIGGVFVPVSDIERSRDWYCGLLGLPSDGEILFGHLFVVPMEGPSLVLDSKIYTPEVVLKAPAFHLNTLDIDRAYDYVKASGAELLTDIEHDHWFNFKDPDGNVLMICRNGDDE
ncbi:VOC family protein [Paenibacillus sp. NFR01]|uniref:VOC family protein n=1 Tax=Paenibacillus sp. NFR01 TaxID=1566279 RepID=UPI0008BBBA83|nr:VOC family protein [Paenibacillus sp. NFR01]SET28538.1 Catechol 2,3-dioxygenase [Paenibacillus sp. NFR01]